MGVVLITVEYHNQVTEEVQKINKLKKNKNKKHKSVLNIKLTPV